MKNHLFPRHLISILAGIIALSLSVVGCGGGSGSGASCGKVLPCGGNVVGNWKVTESCFLSDSTPPDFCPTATTVVDASMVTGNVAYMASMNFSGMLSVNITAVITYPNSCLTINGTTLTCADFDAAQKQSLAMNPDPSIASISCTPAGASCRCTAVGAPQSMNASGTWMTAGTKLTSTQPGMMPDESDYCISGNNLHIIGLDMTMPMGNMGQFKISNDIVFAKQ